MDLTKITILRRLTKDYSSQEITKVINHLTKIKEEKTKEEKQLKDSIEKKEKARLEAVEVLTSSGIPIPPELSKKLSFEDEIKKRTEARKKRAARKAEEAIANADIDPMNVDKKK